MRCRSRLTLCLALLALLTPVPALASAKTPRKPPAKKAANPPVEAPRAPLPQELPPVAPTVTYEDGLLTIVAQNSTLFDVLAGVRKATGAIVDAPASAGERVATRLGPGRPRDVLTELLNGSHYDYILLSPAENPGGVRRLILRARSGGDAAEPVGTAGGTLISPSPPRPAPGARTLPPDASEEEPAPEETVEPAEEAPPEQPAAPPQLPEVKTPEQLQEELRQHEEEQRQQQQQQQQQGQPPQ